MFYLSRRRVTVVVVVAEIPNFMPLLGSFPQRKHEDLCLLDAGFF
jgi:hypothetical protein